MKSGTKKVVFRHYRELQFDETKLYPIEAEWRLIKSCLSAGYIPILVTHIKDLDPTKVYPNPRNQFPTKVYCYCGYAGKKSAPILYEQYEEQLRKAHHQGDIINFVKP